MKSMTRTAKHLSLTALIERNGRWFVALCPEVDVASQGRTIQEARKNLVEALELFFEVAGPAEIKRRMKSEMYVTRVEVAVA
jgi:predicted RNase H-like HicB family nuclease